MGLPNYLAGLVDAGGESHMLAAGKPGWIVVRAQVKVPDSSGDYNHLEDKRLGVIVVLSYQTGHQGSMPNSHEYDLFAQQCAAFVRKSRGARIWVIGNEPNTARERSGTDGAVNSGELVTPEM